MTAVERCLSGTVRIIDVRDDRTARLVRRLQVAAYSTEARQIGNTNLPPLRNTIGDIQDSGCLSLGVYRGAKLIGCLMFKRSGGAIDVHRLMVSPSNFRSGIATQLLHYLGQHEPGSPVIVTAAARNRAAIMLYRKWGFRKKGCLLARGGVALVQLKLESRANEQDRLDPSGAGAALGA